MFGSTDAFTATDDYKVNLNYRVGLLRRLIAQVRLLLEHETEPEFVPAYITSPT